MLFSYNLLFFLDNNSFILIYNNNILLNSILIINLLRISFKEEIF